MNDFDATGIGSDLWATVDGQNMIIHLSNETIADIVTDGSSFQVRYLGVPISEALPYRAGAVEFLRRWMRDNSLTSVPSPAQAERAARTLAKGASAAIQWVETPRAKPAPAPAPAPAFDPLAFAAMIADQLKPAKE